MQATAATTSLASLAAASLSVRLLHAFVRMSERAGRRQTEVGQSLLTMLADTLGAAKLLKATARESLVAPLLERDTNRLDRAQRKRVLSGRLKVKAELGFFQEECKKYYQQKTEIDDRRLVE